MVKRNLIYNIAGHYVEIFPGFPERVKKMLQGFEPFLADANDDHDPLLQFIIDCSREPAGNSILLNERDVIRRFDIEGGRCTFGRSGDKYRFEIEDGERGVTLRLEMKPGSPVVNCTCNPSAPLNPGYLKFSLWMAAAFTGLPRKTAALHSSVVIYDNRAVLFLGESGTGKSTHTKLWTDHIVGSRLLNDDSPFIRIEPDENNQLSTFVYGSPWSGKGRRYINERYLVAALVRLEQHPLNEIVKLNKLEAFGALYPSFPPAFLKDAYFEEQVCGIISGIIASTPVYRLQCLPDRLAAELVRKTVFINN